LGGWLRLALDWQGFAPLGMACLFGAAFVGASKYKSPQKLNSRGLEAIWFCACASNQVLILLFLPGVCD
jgi:hypothetical protein